MQQITLRPSSSAIAPASRDGAWPNRGEFAARRITLPTEDRCSNAAFSTMHTREFSRASGRHGERVRIVRAGGRQHRAGAQRPRAGDLRRLQQPKCRRETRCQSEGKGHLAADNDRRAHDDDGRCHWQAGHRPGPKPAFHGYQFAAQEFARHDPCIRLAAVPLMVHIPPELVPPPPATMNRSTLYNFGWMAMKTGPFNPWVANTVTLAFVSILTILLAAYSDT